MHYDFQALAHKIWTYGLKICKKALCNKVVIALAIACTECFFKSENN